MSDLPMKQEDHPAHNMPAATEDYQGDELTELTSSLYYQKAVDDRKEVDAGKRFYDTGTRIPGAQKAKNDNWTSRNSKPSKDY